MEIFSRGILYLRCIISNLPNYKTKVYKGISSTVFNDRYGNHRAFNIERYKTNTELPIVGDIKNINATPKISWIIFRRLPPSNPESKWWCLCLNEEVEIAMHKEDNLLNRQCEVISECCHQNKYKASNLTLFHCSDTIT